MNKEISCPTALHAAAALRMSCLLGPGGNAVEKPPRMILTLQEEGSPLSGTGEFEKFIPTGEDAGIYLKDLPPFRFPLTVNFEPMLPKARLIAPVGLRIVEEGKISHRDLFGRWAKGIGYAQVRAVEASREL